MKACLTIGIIALYFSTYLTACQKIEAITLPQAVTNNAVAYHAPTQSVYSFAGLGADKDWRSVHANGFKCAISKRHCETIPPIPDGIGRLAATAQTIGDTIYIFGGYSVSEDGEEISMPEVWAYNVNTQTYSPKANMPVPVDDTVSILYQNRYIYLVSGWHKDDNVVNVQMYDSQVDAWFPATDWPGVPVFGHAGGSIDNVMAVCDGVQIIPPSTPNGKRTFTDISACWRGDIDPNTPTQIQWKKLSPLPGKGHYRMAATGWPEASLIVFAGGSDNPYNYNGIGYDKIPSQASRHVWGYDIKADSYVLFKDKPMATMDHRALLHLGGNDFITVGGMGKAQEVLNTANIFTVRK